MGCAVVFEKENTMFIELLDLEVRPASMSVRTLVSLTVVLCSLGLVGASTGKDDAKFHSSSSLDTVGLGGAVAGVLKTAKGSAAGGGCGC